MKLMLRFLLAALLALGNVVPVAAASFRQDSVTTVTGPSDLRNLNAVSSAAQLGLVYMQSSKTLFAFDSTATAPDNGVTIIQSNWTSGPGRWVSTAPSTVANGPGSYYVGPVSNRGSMASTITLSQKQSQSRVHQVARDNTAAAAIVFGNWAVISRVETNGGAEGLITGAIEYPAGVCNPVKWRGAVSGIVPNGATIQSDLTPLQVPIPKGADYWVWLHWVSAGGIIYNANYQDTANGDFFKYSSGAVADTTQSCGAFTSTDTNHVSLPLAVVGVTNQATVCGIGDSRTYGTNDIYDAAGVRGMLQRPIGANFGFINLGDSGDTAQEFVASHTLRTAVENAYCSHETLALGINDVAGGRTANQIQGDLQSIVRFTPNLVHGLVTMPPKTTSGNSWIDLAGQTVTGNEAARVGANDWMRAGVDGVANTFDAADQVESSRNSGKFIVNGQANYCTNDGTHNSPACYLKFAPAFPASAFVH